MTAELLPIIETMFLKFLLIFLSSHLVIKLKITEWKRRYVQNQRPKWPTKRDAFYAHRNVYAEQIVGHGVARKRRQTVDALRYADSLWTIEMK